MPMLLDAARKPRPRIRRVNRGRGHSYRIDDKPAPGVTTVIGAMMAKPALVAAAAREVARYVAGEDPEWLERLRAQGSEAVVDHLKGAHWRAWSRAAAVGTEVHAIAERAVRGEEIALTAQTEPIWGFLTAAVTFMDRTGIRPVLVESVVGHYGLGYAGTLDVVGELPDGRRTLVDYKTGKDVYPEVALQMAAYRHAEVYLDDGGVERPMADVGITEAWAVQLYPDGDYAVMAVETESGAWDMFGHLVAAHRHLEAMPAWLSASAVTS